MPVIKDQRPNLQLEVKTYPTRADKPYKASSNSSFLGLLMAGGSDNSAGLKEGQICTRSVVLGNLHRRSTICSWIPHNDTL